MNKNIKALLITIGIFITIGVICVLIGWLIVKHPAIVGYGSVILMYCFIFYWIFKAVKEELN